MTQADLAERIGKSVQLIGRIERGSAAPSFETLEALSSALQRPIRDFFGVSSHTVTAGDDGPLARIVERASVLDRPDLEWLDKVVTAVLGRKRGRD